MLQRLVELAAGLAGADCCVLASLDAHALRIEAGCGDGVARLVGSTFSLSDHPADVLGEMRHTAIVPLTSSGSTGALMIIGRRDEGPFTAADTGWLSELGQMAMLARRNAGLIADGRRAQQRGLEALTSISRHVASSDDPATFFGMMSQTVAGLVGAQRAAFWRLASGELVAQREAYGFSAALLDTMRLSAPTPGDGSSLAAMLFGGEARRYVAGRTTLTETQAAMARRMRVHDVLAVPWRTAAGPIGMLIACDSAAGFSGQDEWIMRLAARASALVWQGYEAEQRVEQLQADERGRLEAHAERMAALEQQKSEFLQLTSHELRTPITLVMGYLSMLEEGALGDLPESAARVVPLMTTRVRQMNQLVDRMLTTSRTELRSRDTVARDLLLGDVVHAVAASEQATPIAAGRVVTVDVVGSPHAFADPDSVEIIVANLVSNALKYSPDGGTVSIAVRGNGTWATVAVSDSGMGIEPADLAKLFVPFARLESAQASGIEGVGLGLYLSRSLAMLNGGDIEVSSTPGAGSTFTLRVPQRRPAGE